MKLKQILINIKKSARGLSQKSEEEKIRFLQNLAKILFVEKEKIIAANRKDIAFAKSMNLSKAFIDRLKLDEKGIGRIIQSLNTIQKMEDPIGRVIEKRRLDNGLLLQKLSVPLGVILSIYESRPEVTIDVAALCIKSGNCAILKGGKEAFHTNKVLYNCIRLALKSVKLSAETITFIANKNDIGKLLKQNKYIDLVIARGGYQMVNDIKRNSKIPVLGHGSGGARIYVAESANLTMAEKIIINSKISKPAACNSVDTILVHKEIAAKFIPHISKKLKLLNVEIRQNEWDKEFLDLIISIKTVRDIDEAIEFMQKYSKHHTEGIVAEDKKVIDKFINNIDAAALFVNCSTRLHDGGVFGMGAEMGISTGKLHARGPVGLSELTTYKWVVRGNGQIRI